MGEVKATLRCESLNKWNKLADNHVSLHIATVDHGLLKNCWLMQLLFVNFDK